MNRIAVLLDLDNIKPKLDIVEEICKKHGSIVIRRAFSNTPSVLTAYGSKFREFDYRFELTPGLIPVSQEVDNLIFETAEELINNSKLNINTIAIVSNDNGYSRLFTKLKSRKIKTIIIGTNIGNKCRETADYKEFLKDEMRSQYIGIDLGTTNTVISLTIFNEMTKQYNASVLEVPLKDENSSLVRKATIPSSVRFNSLDNGEIGGHIKNNAYAFRDQTILAWKHNIGDSDNGKPFYYQLTSGEVTPEMAASQVLTFCRQQLLDRYGNVEGVVITHPASYESDAIEATRKAAVLAGWQEAQVVLLSEPQAALYDFLHSMQKGDIPPRFNVNHPSNIMVYDLGGGTLDVTLHEVQWSEKHNNFVINDIAIGSRTRVGGDKIDQLIANYILEYGLNNVDLSLGDRDKLSYELPIYAEKFKRLWGGEYSYARDKTEFKMSFQGTFLEGNVPIRHSIDTEKMKSILKELLCPDLTIDLLEMMNPDTAFNESPFIDRFDTFIVPILDVLLKAKATLKQVPKVDGILLNGGMTYFPLIKERLREFFGDILILDEGNPDLAVAKGASLFASGALSSVERVNPTNIYLEAITNGNSKLNLLIAQGQKYPFKTCIKDTFKLPQKDSGNLMFKIWVGMGNKININTKQERSRQVALNNIFASNLKQGDLLDLEIEYTFDERLLLTLVSQKNQNARFKIEVASDAHEVEEITKISNPVNLQTLIPEISRIRHGKIIQPNIRVNFQHWEDVAIQLGKNFNNGRLHDRRRDLVKQTTIATNRSQIIDDLIRWLEIDSFFNSPAHNIKTVIAVSSLGEILSLINLEDSPNIKASEAKLEKWVQMKINQDLGRLDDRLYQAIVNLPGKLYWSGFDAKLIEGFKYFQMEAKALVFLNSLGKCGECNTNNLDFLRHIIKTGKHMAHKQKAAWALARLISPGQPKQWRINFTQVNSIAQFALDQLYGITKQPQVALDLLGCLSQCLAWQLLDFELENSIYKRVEQLEKTDLPVYKNLSGFSHIESVFKNRLDLLSKMLHINTISDKDSTEIKQWLLESIKE
jgi:molecular chaperone DnaK (HSP70)